ncbi:MAG: translation initiation factor IF-6 [Candidatus Thermoplasmatota archaeon]|nr:translation initiation factor IF-6 [Candidatus Thermoplasmatota archaeon]
MIRKISILRNNFIGIYARIWEDVAYIPLNTEDQVVSDISETLGVKTIKVLIDNSYLIGSMMVLNSNGMLLPDNSLEYRDDHDENGRNVSIMKDKINAIGNDIIADDRVALVHKSFTKSSLKKIEDCLGVEAVKGSIGGIKTVGTAAVLSKKGMIVTPGATEEEIKFLSELFKTNVKAGTANFGSIYVGASILANSKGVLVGADTTPIELGRIDDVLS